MARDDFSQDVVRTVAERVGYSCSNPECGALTIGPAQLASKARRIGVAAHIAAASKLGPRYDATQSPKERKSLANAIWLCQTCSREIDSDHSAYSVEELQRWKTIAEGKADLSFGLSLPSSQYKLGVNDQTMYINVQRFAEMAFKVGIPVRDKRPNKEATLLDLGGDLMQYVVELEFTLNQLKPRALPIDKLRVQALGEVVGSLISFSGNFRTKNSPKKIVADRLNANAPIGNIEIDHHLYKKFGSIKLVLPLDYHWIASRSAEAFFCDGWVSISGIAKVHKQSNGVLTASPLWLALPASPFMNAIYSAWR